MTTTASAPSHGAATATTTLVLVLVSTLLGLASGEELPVSSTWHQGLGRPAGPTPPGCHGQCAATESPPPPGPPPLPRTPPPPPLTPRAFKPLPLGSVVPQGWLLEQLLIQANGVAGAMLTSHFPGADVVSGSRQGLTLVQLSAQPQHFFLAALDGLSDKHASG